MISFKFKGFLIFLLLINVYHSVFPQNSKDENYLSQNVINLYLKCSSCDFNYLRDEIKFVNFVIEPTEAQIFLLVTSQSTGSGGTQYSLFFIGQKEFKGISDTFYFSVSPDNTQDEERKLMLMTIKAGLVRYAAKTPVISSLSIDYKESISKKEVEDKWKSWIFRLSSYGSGSFERSYQSLSLNSSFSAEKVTEQFKTEFSLNHYYSENHYLIQNKVLKTFSRSYSLYNMSVKSMGKHWSSGLTTAVSSSVYRNIRYSHSLGPAIEYNILPYSEASRRQCRIKYTIGYRFNHYFDTTLYGKTEENLCQQAIGVAFKTVQKWGNINLSLQGSNYLHDFSKNNIYLYISTDIRLVKGLSFSTFGWFTIAHDQIELPKYDATPEEVLLRIRELESQYNFYGYAGLTYTFGSIYNNVVNPRFGN